MKIPALYKYVVIMSNNSVMEVHGEKMSQALDSHDIRASGLTVVKCIRASMVLPPEFINNPRIPH